MRTGANKFVENFYRTAATLAGLYAERVALNHRSSRFERFQCVFNRESLELSTANGSIQVKGPFAIDAVSRSEFRGSLGQGGPPRIAVGTSSGDIAIVASVARAAR